MARYMLDTDTCSYIMKRSNQMVLTRLQAVPVDGRLHVGHHQSRNCSTVLKCRRAERRTQQP